MRLGDRDTITAGPMAVAWREASRDLGIRFESPFAMTYRGVLYWCSGWLSDFGSPRGAIIAGRETHDDIFEASDALDYYSSGLSALHYEHYDRERFMATLNDWGWFGQPADTPSWFTGWSVAASP